MEPHQSPLGWLWDLLTCPPRLLTSDFCTRTWGLALMDSLCTEQNHDIPSFHSQLCPPGALMNVCSHSLAINQVILPFKSSRGLLQPSFPQGWRTHPSCSHLLIRWWLILYLPATFVFQFSILLFCCPQWQDLFYSSTCYLPMTLSAWLDTC